MKVVYKVGCLLCWSCLIACSNVSHTWSDYRHQRRVQDSVALEQHSRSVVYNDSLLSVLLPQVDTLLPSFVYEKNAKYADKGYYTHRLLTTNRHIQHTFLQPRVRDDGYTLVKSFYFGDQRLSHTHLRLSAAGVSTDVEGSVHAFQAQGEHEIMTLDEDPSLALLQWVDGFSASRIVVTLEGKGTYKYVLPANEVKAIIDSYRLAVLMKDIQRVESQGRQASLQVEKYKKRLQKAN